MAKNTNDAAQNKSKVPHIYVVLFMMILLAIIASYIVPSGEYNRVTDDSGAATLEPG